MFKPAINFQPKLCKILTLCLICICTLPPTNSYDFFHASDSAGEIGPDFRISEVTGRLLPVQQADMSSFCTSDAASMPGTDYVTANVIFASGAVVVIRTKNQSALNFNAGAESYKTQALWHFDLMPPFRGAGQKVAAYEVFSTQPFSFSLFHPPRIIF